MSGIQALGCFYYPLAKSLALRPYIAHTTGWLSVWYSGCLHYPVDFSWLDVMATRDVSFIYDSFKMYGSFKCTSHLNERMICRKKRSWFLASIMTNIILFFQKKSFKSCYNLNKIIQVSFCYNFTLLKTPKLGSHHQIQLSVICGSSLFSYLFTVDPVSLF